MLIETLIIIELFCNKNVVTILKVELGHKRQFYYRSSMFHERRDYDMFAAIHTKAQKTKHKIPKPLGKNMRNDISYFRVPKYA